MAFREFTTREWIDEIQYGLEFRRRFGLEDKWAEIEAIYYNVHKSMMNDGPNIFMSTGDSMLSNLTVPNPYVIVKPMTREAVAKANLVESLDNLLLIELALQEEVETSCLHAYLFGKGFIKSGYDSEFGFDPSLDIMGNLHVGMTFSQVDRKGKRRIEHDAGIAPGMPWTRAVDPRDIVVPYGTTKLQSAPWIAHRIIRQIDDLRADPKYENTQRLEPRQSMDSFIESYKSRITVMRPGNLRKPDFVEMWEIHDRRTGEIKVVVADWDKFLRKDINALQIENRLPFASIGFTPRTRAFWTTSDAYYLRYAQAELSDMAVQRTKQRRLSVLKFLADRSTINEEELQKLLSPDVGAVGFVEPGEDIQKAILPVSAPAVNQGLMLEEEHVRQNAREQVGFSRNQLGEYVGGRRTATEAKVVQGASELRMSRRGLAVKRLYEDTIQIVNGIVFKNWIMPRWIEILGPEQAMEWQQISGPGIDSRYSYNVTFSNDEEARQRSMEALQLYQLLSQDPSVDPVALREYLGNKINDPAFTKIFNAQIQSAMQMLRLRDRMVQPKAEPSANGKGGSNGALPQLPMSVGVNGQGRM